MNLLQIADCGTDQIRVSWQRGKMIPRHYPQALSFADPLTIDDRKELRWYLEEYLQFPYGAERDRAQRIEAQMAAWGESLFRQLFPKAEEDPDPRGFYQEAVREGLEQCEVCISSEDPGFLNIPWELLRDPTPGRGYLAPLLGGLYRHRSGQKIEAPIELAPGDPFRILLVIARPYGERDVPLGTVARPVLEAVRPLRPRAELEVLRPPTFEMLVRRLNEQRGHYHLVHFDGHGVFVGDGSGPLMRYAAMGGRGHLVFETETGEPYVVSSRELGQALATCKVPLFVLNACQSAEEGLVDPFSSVAAQLVAVGAKGVVAMSYSVYAITAALFMERFYERLVAHAALSEAVAAARQRLYAAPHRESVVGPLELQDWSVPTLYQQELGYVPIRVEVGAPTGEEESPEAVLRQRAEEVCPAGRFGFVGRDYDILRIERALRRDETPWVLLTGMGGTGKTELAFGFARWYAETGGCSGGVFVVSFRDRASFGQVVGSIAGYGTDFSQLPEEEQWQFLVSYLQEHPCLLVWDNFETVAGYGAGAEPLATAEEQAKLARFLQALRGGKSRVLLTSRKPEEVWLGIAYELVEVRGLTERDAAQLAERILRTVGRRPQDYRDDPGYARLLRLLAGHPLSLEVVLPHLQRRSPADVIDALQHQIESLGDLLDASLSYGFSQLSEQTRRHLPLVGLFAAHVHAGIIAAFVTTGYDQQDVFQEIMGEVLDDAGWRAVLAEAASAGLLRLLQEDFYELHPTLPVFLRQELASDVGEAGLRRLEFEFMVLYAALAARALREVQKGEHSVTRAVSIDQANLLRALRLAETGEEWAKAQDILQILSVVYEARGQQDDWRTLRRATLRQVGRQQPTEADREKARLWMFLLNSEANDALRRNELAAAETMYQRILDYLLSLNDAGEASNLAVVYHQLGMVAYDRRRFDHAEEWHQRALAIYQQLGLEPDAASEHHHLGMVAHQLRDFDQAEACYHQALAIKERLGLKPSAASTYHQLGIVAEQRGELDQAEEWYLKALAIYERLDLEPGTAREYHMLGSIAEERGQFDQAEAWYRKALAVNERLGFEREAGAGYHHLGNVAFQRGQLDQAEAWYRRAMEIYERLDLLADVAGQCRELGTVAFRRGQLTNAEAWYQKALAIFEQLGLEHGASMSCHGLGLVAEAQGHFEQAEVFYHESLAIKERLNHPPLQVETMAQLGLLCRKQQRLDEAVKWYGEALVIAEAHEMWMSGQILFHLAAAMRLMGEDPFTVCWRQAFPDKRVPIEELRYALQLLEEQSN